MESNTILMNEWAFRDEILADPPEVQVGVLFSKPQYVTMGTLAQLLFVG